MTEAQLIMSLQLTMLRQQKSHRPWGSQAKVLLVPGLQPETELREARGLGTEAARLNQWRQDKTSLQVQGAEDIASRRQTQGEAELFSKNSMTSQKELRETSLMTPSTGPIISRHPGPVSSFEGRTLADSPAHSSSGTRHSYSGRVSSFLLDEECILPGLPGTVTGIHELLPHSHRERSYSRARETQQPYYSECSCS